MAEPYYPFDEAYLWAEDEDTGEDVFNPYRVGFVNDQHIDPTRPHENLEWGKEGNQWKLSLPQEYRHYPEYHNPMREIDLPPGYTIERETEYDEDDMEIRSWWAPKFTGVGVQDEGSEIIPTYQDPSAPDDDGGGDDDGDDDFDWVITPPTPPVTPPPPIPPTPPPPPAAPLPPWAGSAGYESQFNVPAQNIVGPSPSGNALPWAQSAGYEPGPQVPAQNVIMPDKHGGIEARVGPWPPAIGEGTRFFMANGGLATLPTMRRAAPWKWRSGYSRR